MGMLNHLTAIITGGSRGIGRAIALRMAQEGANIAILYAGNSAAAEETAAMLRAAASAPASAGAEAVTVSPAAAAFAAGAAESGRLSVRAYQCDVSDFQASKSTFEQILSDFGQADILVNNAGIVKDKLFIAMKEEDFDRVLAVNLKGTFNMIKHVGSYFAKRRSGRIINISSVSALLGTAGQANYVSSKAGVIGLTRTVARELGGRNVTCNAIAPGYIETDMTEGLKEEIKQNYIEQIPLKRFGKPEDVANAAVFLASPLASYITGEVLRVDGGIV